MDIILVVLIVIVVILLITIGYLYYRKRNPTITRKQSLPPKYEVNSCHPIYSGKLCDPNVESYQTGDQMCCGSLDPAIQRSHPVTPISHLGERISEKIESIDRDFMTIRANFHLFPLNLYSYYAAFMANAISTLSGQEKLDAAHLIDNIVQSQASMIGIAFVLKKFMAKECISDEWMLLEFLTKVATQSRAFVDERLEAPYKS